MTQSFLIYRLVCLKIPFKITLLFCPIYAQPVPSPSVRIEGNKRTLTEFILQELDLNSNSVPTQLQIDKGLQNLKNLQIFSNVAAEQEGKVWVVRVTEKWTTIPIAKFNAGGGTTKTTLGLYDVNVGGTYLELGAQAEKLGSAYSGVAWFRNPRLFGQKRELFMTLGTQQKRDTLFKDYGESSTKLAQIHAQRSRYTFQIENQWVQGFRAGLLWDSTQDTTQPPVYEQPNTLSRPHFYYKKKSRYNAPGAVIKIGRLNHQGTLVDGTIWELKSSVARREMGSSQNFSLSESSLLTYFTWAERGTFASRLGVGITNAKHIQDAFVLGGLDKIRGFEASRFYGRSFAQSNHELRFAVWESQALSIQTVGFVDSLKVGDSLDQWRPFWAVSAGGGLRFIAPQIYRLVVRMDYARGITLKTTVPLSFGIQQFI